MATPPLLVPNPDKGIEGQSPFVTAAMCVWAEARGETFAAKKGVANVINNRVNHSCWWGNDIKSVVLRKWQFSSFNKDNLNTPQNEEDPNRHKMLEVLKYGTAEVWEECIEAVRDVFVRKTPDITNGATHYYDISLDKKKLAPPWATKAEMTIQLGRIKFFKGVV